MTRARFLAAALTLLAGPALADELAPIGGGGQLVRTALGLVLILGLVFGLAWAAKRVSGSRLVGRGGGGPIQIVGQQALGVKERLLLVEVDGQRILLGVSPGRISRLAELGPGPGDFDDHLDAVPNRETRL